MNVTKGLWLWTRSFLDGRSQQVNLGGVSSSVKSCPAGVPQGSVKSPTLFNVHANDLENSVPDHLSINTCKYADDCTQDEVLARGTASHMQEVLDPTENMMKINPKQNPKDMWICFSSAIPVYTSSACYGERSNRKSELAQTTWSMASGRRDGKESQ